VQRGQAMQLGSEDRGGRRGDDLQIGSHKPPSANSVALGPQTMHGGVLEGARGCPPNRADTRPWRGLPTGFTELPIVTIPESRHIPVGRAKVRS
jgi:hypothetical protein